MNISNPVVDIASIRVVSQQIRGIEFPEFHGECKTARLINDYVTLRQTLVNPSR